jgi:hypothetical protein
MQSVQIRQGENGNHTVVKKAAFLVVQRLCTSDSLGLLIADPELLARIEESLPRVSRTQANAYETEW